LLKHLKYLNKARYLQAVIGIIMIPVGVGGAALVLYQVQHHQATIVHATLALTGAILIAACGLGLAATYLRP
jgi:nitric oxide reductase large subunit